MKLKIIKKKVNRSKQEKALQAELAKANGTNKELFEYTSLVCNERDELRTLLCMLYGGLLGDRADLEHRMLVVKKAFLLNEETGTYPACWNHPQLQQIARRAWSDRHEALAKEYNTDLVISRTVGCSQCGFVFRFVAASEIEKIHCPKCNFQLKW